MNDTSQIPRPLASGASAQPVGAPPPVYIGALLLSIASLTVIANAAVAPSIPGLRDAFKDTAHVNTLAALVITLPSLGIVLTAGLGGWLCDRFGRRPVMLWALLLYGLAGASSFVAQSLGQVLVGRLLLGIGIGGTMTATMAMIGDRYQGLARARLFSIQPAVMSGSGLAMILIGGFLGELGWRYPFLVYAIALVLLPLAHVHLPESERARVQATADKEPFSVRPFMIVGVSALIAMITYYMLPTRLPFLLRDLGISAPSVAGLIIGAGNLTMIAMALIYTRFGTRFGPYTIYAMIFATTGIGYALIAMAPSWPLVVAGAALSGAGYGWLFPVNNIILMERASEAVRGRAAGFHTTSIFLGQFLSPVISGPIADHSGTAAAFGWFAAASAAVSAAFVLARLRLGQKTGR